MVTCNPIAFCVVLAVDDLDQIRISKKRSQQLCLADIRSGNFQSDNELSDIEASTTEKGIFSLAFRNVLS